MRVPSDRDPSREPPGAREAARVVALCTASVIVMAFVQHAIVLHQRPPLVSLLIPAAVGLTFGALVASLRAARARERSMARELAAAQEARVEAVTRLAGTVGHDLNNVFCVAVSCSAEVRGLAAAGREGPCRGCVPVLEELDDALARARSISRQLVMLARSSGAPPQRLDLGAVVEDLTPMLRRLVGATVRLEVVAAPGVPVRADRTELEQLVLNLAVNARDAMPRGGTLAITVGREGPGAVLAVRDTGVGMDEEVRARMFEPFFTTKSHGRGTGLGLAVVAQVAQRASARLAVRSAPREGTEVRVTFPLAGDADADAAPAA